ncbi:PREDICTED: 28S ribosomal protein S30, mitochondrial-like [Amphimedon queenslandica]|uniref:Uncharacterized protein n=1 Tax=Amphimedon queenslandica TaxID=400682 RepID=A0A1X7VW43_AMPQE|nr:PREDICTED: 28S ribosomal protein S30, mitochondrial-like [Amphimedon queenslandica]|eukprot:XP_011404360.1 PREDICTED: 28S ribosomal protein S30, mitochondrial-like [Amphimedon queenslandica]
MAHHLRASCFLANRSSTLKTFSRCYGYVHVVHKTIPHLLGPGNVWRKCYVVHPCSVKKDSLLHAQWLTGTKLVNGLPKEINSISLPNDFIVTEFKERLIDYMKISPDTTPLYSNNNNLNFGLYQACLSCLWSLGNFQHIQHSYWSPITKVTSYWRRNGLNFVTFTKPSILYTSSALDLWPTPSTTTLVDPVKYLNPSHIQLFEQSFDDINVFGGNKSLSLYPMAHTLIVDNDYKKHTLEQTISHALLQLFAQSSAQTVQNGYPLDRRLDYPLATQAILTDGLQYTFACYQLNTLNMTETSQQEVFNYMWCGPTYKIWNKEKTDLNNKCVTLLLKFLLNEPLRETPALVCPVNDVKDTT